MALTRNQRRKAAKARLLAKSERIAKAELGRQADERAAIVARNLSSPREFNPYPQSQWSKFGDNGPRAVSSGRGAGSMERRRALALKARGSY